MFRDMYDEDTMLGLNLARNKDIDFMNLITVIVLSLNTKDTRYDF